MIQYENRWRSFHIWHRQRLGAFPQHLHDYVEIIYICNGESSCTVDMKPYDLHAGDVLFVFPNRIHSYNKSAIDTENYALLFPNNISVFDEIFAHSVPECPVLHTAVDADTARLFAAAEAERARGDTAYLKGAFLGYISIILSRLLPKLTLRPCVPEENQLERRLIEYCSLHYTERITLQSVADTLGYTPTYLSHVFSEKFNIGFSEFITTLRLEEAKKQLKKSATVTSVAYDCGFGGVRNFNRVFKEKVGQTPTEYRKDTRG